MILFLCYNHYYDGITTEHDMGKPTEMAGFRSKWVWEAVSLVTDVPIEDMGLNDRQRLLDAANKLTHYLDVRFVARLKDLVQ